MKTTFFALALLTGAAALMPVEIAHAPDAGLDLGAVSVDGGVDMSHTAAEAARESAMVEAQARVSQGADLRRTYAELRVELARLDAIISGLQGDR